MGFGWSAAASVTSRLRFPSGSNSRDQRRALGAMRHYIHHFSTCQLPGNAQEPPSFGHDVVWCRIILQAAIRLFRPLSNGSCPSSRNSDSALVVCSGRICCDDGAGLDCWPACGRPGRNLSISRQLLSRVVYERSQCLGAAAEASFHHIWYRRHCWPGRHYRGVLIHSVQNFSIWFGL